MSNTADRMSDWICPLPVLVARKKNKKRSPNIVPTRNDMLPGTRKESQGLVGHEDADNGA